VPSVALSLPAGSGALEPILAYDGEGSGHGTLLEAAGQLGKGTALRAAQDELWARKCRKAQSGVVGNLRERGLSPSLL
jgi:hypothetical protein